MSPAKPLGPRVFLKHVLSFGRWTDSKGRTLTVDRPLLERVVRSFKAGALDQVPIVLATDDNAHNDLPERFRGAVTGLDVRRDGLYATAEMTHAGAELIKANPRLGVSVRLLAESKRGDGVTHRDVLSHVLATLRPQIPGLRPWAPVQLAAAAGDVVDLSAGRAGAVIAPCNPSTVPLPGSYRPGQTADDLGLPTLPGHAASAPPDGRHAFQALIEPEHDDPDVDAELYGRGEAWAMDQLRKADPATRRGPDYGPFIGELAAELRKVLR